MESQNYYKPPKPGPLLKLFWKACGADSSILQKCDYREHVKYACLGGIVVATGLLAGLAGGYAFYTIFEPKGSAIEAGTDTTTLLLSILFGMIWGTIIFNIDRFIVTSTGQGDGTEAITREELIGALPRILMGIIIAITISKPLEIRIFKSEIDVELEQAQLVEQTRFITSLDSIYEPRINTLKSKIAVWKGEIEDKRDRFTELEQEFIDETQGERGNNRGVGPIAKAIKDRADLARVDLNSAIQKNQPLIDSTETQILQVENERKKRTEDSKEIADGLDGLLERLKLVHKIAGFWITFFITLLFVAIELTPIFFKLMLIKSPYDYLSDNHKEMIKAAEGIEVRHDYYQDKTGKQRDLVIYHQARRQMGEQAKLTEAHEEIKNYIIEKWKEKEKEKIDQDPYRYIETLNDRT
ncbi:MAG: DUF4407 domain-containing protein [Saprospiraceae bacterium]|nr:DUF4407 domain-containing protein [Saprospiraceae bacterium]